MSDEDRVGVTTGAEVPVVDPGTYVVTSGGDVTDASDAVLTLREAIAAAKAGGTDATITFATGIATVTLTQGELVIDGTSVASDVGLTIAGGAGAGVQIVQGAATGRVMHIEGAADIDVQLVKLSNLTLEQGKIIDGAGGGLLAVHANLDLENCLIASNTVTVGAAEKLLSGGGLALVGCVTTIEGGSVERNQITSEFDNRAEGRGGGIYAAGGSLRLHQASVDYNAVSGSYVDVHGGGIYAKVDELEITFGEINGNSARGKSAGGGSLASGGGLALAGTGTTIISYSTIASNTAFFYDNSAEGGGVVARGGSLDIDHSYIGKNYAGGFNAYASGGGLAADDVQLSLHNSTIHGNQVVNTYIDPDTKTGGGGGVYLRKGSAEFVSATIAGNAVTLHGPGGIYAVGVVPTIVNSIVAGNTGADASIADVSGGISSNNANLFGQAAVAGAGPGDLLGSDPMLGTPDFHGGPTFNLPLLPGSPAAGRGIPDDAHSTTDQRGTGYARVVDGDMDIGAFQRQSYEQDRPLFTPGDDAVDLRKVDLALYPGILGTESGAGADTVYLSSTQNLGTLFVAGPGNDVVFGGSRHDKITGSQGDDRIGGGGGDDLLYGGLGNDRLHGDGGKDTLKGSAGADAFIFVQVSDSLTGAGRDLILDFTSRQGDLIDLAKIDANAGLTGNQAFVWKGSGSLTGVGQLHYRHEGGHTLVEGNLSGSAAPEIQIELHGHLALAAGDFLL